MNGADRCAWQEQCDAMPGHELQLKPCLALGPGSACAALVHHMCGALATDGWPGEETQLSYRCPAHARLLSEQAAARAAGRSGVPHAVSARCSLGTFSLVLQRIAVLAGQLLHDAGTEEGTRPRQPSPTAARKAKAGKGEASGLTSVIMPCRPYTSSQWDLSP